MRKISVVVTAGKLNEEVARLVKSLEAQSLKPFEVIIVTPFEGDCKGILERNALHIKIITLRRDPGPILSRIFGGLASSGDLVAFIDSDCIAPPNWLESMSRDMREYGVDVVAGSVVGINREKMLARLQEYSLISPNPKYREKRVVTGDLGLNLVVTANMLLKKEVLYSEDVFPPGYGRLGFEDIDFITRILRAGYRVLLSTTHVYHYNRTSLTRILKRFYEYGGGLPLYRRSCPGSFYGKAVASLVFLLLMLLVASTILIITGHIISGLAVGLAPLLTLYSYHAVRTRPFKPEVLLYPPVEYLLAIAATLGVLVRELKLVLRGGE